MAYPRTDETLSLLMQAAVSEDSEISSSLDIANYSYESLGDRISASAPTIWEAASEEIRDYDKTQEEIARHTEECENTRSMPESDVPAIELWVSRLEALLLTLILLAFLSLVVSGGSILWTWWRGPGGLLEEAVAGRVALTAGAAFIALFLTLGILLSAQAKLVARAKTEHGRQYKAWKAEVDGALSARGIPALREALNEKKSRIEGLLTKRVQSEIVALINERLAPSYEVKLAVHEPRGLGEVFDKRLTISTPARERLEFLLSNMPGGSIGIAGSRGAGKTTLLRNFCGPKRVVEALNGKEVLGILVSAPVAYQSRDFLLYLFTVTCQNVIEAEGGQFQPPEIASDPTPREEPPAWPLVRRLPIVLARSGFIIAILGLLFATLLALFPTSPTSIPVPRAAAGQAQTTSSAQFRARAEATRRSPGRPVSQATDDQFHPISGDQPSAVTDGRQEEAFLIRWATALKVDPRAFFVLAGVLFAMAIVLAELFGRSPVRMMRRALWSIFFPSAYRQHIAFAPQHKSRHAEDLSTGGSKAPAGSLQAEAEAWLMTTKFQQSYTSGWSGSLKLPIGLEGGLNRAVSLAKNQMSVPELVYFFTRFLERVASQYQVIIGIDELDKLASDELARQFINDIKSLFGIEHCFYLVSVSENAMSSFERRGLPFRDEFDSAFDELLYVDYLSFFHATQLLDRRVVGRPIPFFAFSYCMSGGLPRDLIRTFRSVLEVHARNQGANCLSHIVGSIVTTDVLSKSRAASVAARSLKLEPEVDEFLTLLAQIGVAAPSNKTLMSTAREILNSAGTASVSALSDRAAPLAAPVDSETGTRAPSAAEAGGQTRLQPLRDLMEEVATYIEYVVTMRSFFVDALEEKRLVEAIEDGHIDRLAHARRLIAVNPALARSELTSFRRALQVYPQDS